MLEGASAWATSCGSRPLCSTLPTPPTPPLTPLTHTHTQKKQVVYSGNSTARTMLLDHELWLNPSSMDVKMNVSGRAERSPCLPATHHYAGLGQRLILHPLSPATPLQRVRRRMPPATARPPMSKPHTPSSPCHPQRVRQRMSPDGGPPPGRLPKPDVVLASYEAVCADAQALKAIHFEAVVVDVRQRWVLRPLRRCVPVPCTRFV